MNNPESTKVGKVELTPEALLFIESLQYENNHAIKSYSEKFSAFICGSLILLKGGQVSKQIETKLLAYAAELANLALEIEQLSKPLF